MSHAVFKSALSAGLFASCIFSSYVVAEDLPTVVVSATRSQQSNIQTPTSIKVITREQIGASGATSLSEVLRGQMGVHLTDLFGDGADAKVSMRGAGGASNVLVIIDGRRINNIDLKAPNLNSVSIKDIEQVEIVQGSAGALYGDQAVGGVINIITRKPEQFVVDVELFTGSYDRNRVLARVENKIDNGLSFELGADILSTSNYRDNNKLDSMNVLGRVDYEFNTGFIFVEHSRVTDVQELPGSLLAAEVVVDRRQSFSSFVDDYSDAETDVSRVGTNLNLSDAWSLEAELAMTVVERDVQNSFRGFSITSPSAINSRQREFTPRLISVLPMNGSEMLTTLGVDLRNTDYSTEVTSIVDKQKVASFYAQLIVPLHADISVTLGGRHSKVENDVTRFVSEEVNDRATVYEAGVNWKLNSNLNMFARLDENFRFAKVDELTYVSPGDKLDNQKGKSKELGVNYTVKDLSTKLFVSRLELKDEIAYDPTAAAPTGAPVFWGLGANVNLDSTVHDSLVFDAQYSLNKSVDLMANFTYNDAIFDTGALEGNTISGVPEKLFSLASNYRYSEAMKAYAEVIYTGDQYKSGDNSNAQDKHGSYTVVNFNAEYSWEEWTYSIRINNMLDREYAESVNSFGSINPSPERNFWLSAAVRFR